MSNEWHMKGGSEYDDGDNAEMWFYIDIDGFLETEYNNIVFSDIEDEDPYMRFYNDGSEASPVPKAEIGLYNSGSLRFSADKVEFYNGVSWQELVAPSDDAYDATDWNGDTEAATKNAIRDKIESMPQTIMPIGTILMYDGSGIKGGDTSNILTRTDEISEANGDDFDMVGWKVCNGYGSTPNLQDKFIQCENDNVGNTGGANTHTLTTNEIPSHRHTYNEATAGSLYGYPYVTRAWYWFQTSKWGGYTGGGAAHNNMPAYYSVIFIKKMS